MKQTSGGVAKADSGVQLEVFYDGACPLCRREITWLRRRDRASRIRFIDIAGEGFDADQCAVTWDELMRVLHGRLPDGSWVRGTEVLRYVYQAAGYGWLVRVSRWPLCKQLLEWGYRWFAKYRLRLTGRWGHG